jgi:hypothetical protein
VLFVLVHELVYVGRGRGHVKHCEGVILRHKPGRADISLYVPYLSWKFSDDGYVLHTAKRSFP